MAQEEVEVDDNTPAVEEINEETEEKEEIADGTGGKTKLNRNEKKARKMMSKIGLKPIVGVKRVAIKKTRDVLFIISDPEVLKSPSSNTYIIFGEAKVDDANQRAASSAAKQFSQKIDTAKPAPETATETATDAEASTGAADESGYNPNDLDLIMGQADVTKEEAIAALKRNKGDIVNTIMELTVSS